MTDTVVLALIGGVPLAITAVAGLIVALRTSAKTDVILGHVNSEKTASEGRENVLKSENALLRQMLAERAGVAALLAQSTAQNLVSAPSLEPKGT